jgi:hypothetical protein
MVDNGVDHVEKPFWTVDFTGASYTKKRLRLLSKILGTDDTALFLHVGAQRKPFKSIEFVSKNNRCDIKINLMNSNNGPCYKCFYRLWGPNQEGPQPSISGQ